MRKICHADDIDTRQYDNVEILPTSNEQRIPKMRPVTKQPVTILVVEDDPNISIVLSARLTSLGYKVCGTAETGLEAIRDFDRYHPDLITMDILLKGEMTGIETATKIAEKSDVPVIYMTCLSDRKVFERAIGTNPYGFIIKPYDINELRSTIEIALVKHHAARTQAALIAQLKKALKKINTLSGLLPICASCKRIRDAEHGSWQQIEDYIASHSKASFTHGICPDCTNRLYPDLEISKKR